jgi:hypothetical protein
MKNLILISVVVIALFAANIVSAQVVDITGFQSTEEIDAVWDKTPFIKNDVPKEKQVINCEGGGTFRVFVGKVKDIDVRMCRVDMPDVIGSQTTSIQITINNNQRFSCPIKLSYQIFSEPKLIDDEIVVMASIGMYDTNESHFYLSFKKNGDWSTTVVRSKEWKTQN